MQLGAKHVESPFIEFGQISTVLYFLYFIVVMYGITLVENTFVDIAVKYTTPLTTFNVSMSSMDIAILPLAVAIPSFIASFPILPLAVAIPSFIESFPIFMLCVPVSGLAVLGIVLLSSGGQTQTGTGGQTQAGTGGQTQAGTGGQRRGVPGRRCPACLERGDSSWTIPGRCCKICGGVVR